MERKVMCNVLTPTGEFFKGEVDFAVVPAFDGEMGFMYNHAPLIAELGYGEMRVYSGKDLEYLVIEGGFVEISDNELSIFAESAFTRKDLLPEEIEEELDKLTGFEKSLEYHERVKIEQRINKLKLRLKVASK